MLKFLHILIVAYVSCTLILSATAQALPGNKRHNIVTSNYQVAALAYMLLKDKVDITSLIANNSCSHSYSAKPSDKDLITGADIVLYISNDFDKFLLPFLRSANTKQIALGSFDKLQIIKGAGKINWHIWLDLNNNKIILENLAEIFSEKFPEYKRLIYINLEYAIEKLDVLKAEQNRILSDLSDVIILSDSVEYFFQSYENQNLQIFKAYKSNKDSLAYIGKLQQLIDTSTNKCLIISEGEDTKLYNKFDAKLVVFSSENLIVKKGDNLENAFFTNYRKMLDTLKKCANDKVL